MRRREVIVRLAGGTGNQLFQILGGYRVAAVRGVRVVKVSVAALDSYEVARRPFLETTQHWGEVTLNPTREVAPPWFDIPLRICERMKLYGLHKALMQFSGVVAGYCQDMPNGPELTANLPALLRDIRAYTAVGPMQSTSGETIVHIRGGDALLPENRTRYALPHDYYQAVVASGCNLASVFSDDQAYSEAFLQELSTAEWRYVISRRGEDYLRAALSAEVLVLSRSTLSFWGGMLSSARTIFIPEGYPASWLHLLSLAGKADIRVVSYDQ